MSHEEASHKALVETFQFGTRAVHAGQQPDGVTGAVIPSISLSTTFAQTSAGNPIGSFDYSRSGNPSRHNFETAVCSMYFQHNY
jgi:cystathionine gamma-lyase